MLSLSHNAISIPPITCFNILFLSYAAMRLSGVVERWLKKGVDKKEGDHELTMIVSAAVTLSGCGSDALGMQQWCSTVHRSLKFMI